MLVCFLQRCLILCNIYIGVFGEFCNEIGLLAHIYKCGPFSFGFYFCGGGFILCYCSIIYCTDGLVRYLSVV